jgi:hypothetical protein
MDRADKACALLGRAGLGCAADWMAELLQQLFLNRHRVAPRHAVRTSRAQEQGPPALSEVAASSGVISKATTVVPLTFVSRATILWRLLGMTSLFSLGFTGSSSTCWHRNRPYRMNNDTRVGVEGGARSSAPSKLNAVPQPEAIACRRMIDKARRSGHII